MGLPNDDAVLIENAKKPGDPSVITVNCPDKTGLGCDLCRIILDFGLSITKGDVSTDGKWCYVLLWVIPHLSSNHIRWGSLKDRLMSVCPSCLIPFYIHPQSTSSTRSSPYSSSSSVYLLKIVGLDRKGLLYDVTKVLSDLEHTIQRVKVMTTPDDKVMDLFFITDNLDLLHTRRRQDETCEGLNSVLGASCYSCDLQLAGPEFQSIQKVVSALAPAVAENLFSWELSDMENESHALSPELVKLTKGSVTIDNSLSPAHTLLQIHCLDQKGLLYDITRTLKDCSIQVAYGRFSPNTKGYRDIDLFIQQTDGKKIVDPDKQHGLCSRLKLEMLHPLRVTITNRGPDAELLVANPVELSGSGRPRVFYDVTFALKLLGICIFSAEIGRHSTSDRQWEVYKFLLDENREFPLTNTRATSQIVDKVRRTLMGW
ncbi:ACT domain-containing protein acr9 [Ranunculus cassubicifolius]